MLNIAAGFSTSGYNLTRSLRFRASASAYLNRTVATSGNRLTWTWSAWVKRGNLTTSGTVGLFGLISSDNVNQEYIAFNGNQLVYFLRFLNVDQSSLFTTQVFRDPSAWYHIVVAVDNTQATASNRLKMYVNGSQITAFSTATYSPLNQSTLVTGSGFNIGTAGLPPFLGTPYFDGYIAENYYVDGQALTPASFGETNALTGVWQPKAYTGSYGTNGFYLPFTDNSALTTASNVGLGKDFSGNANYWVTNNISITAGVTYDSMTDVPTLTSATASNYCVLSPVDNTSNGSQVNLINGNLGLDLGNGNGRATFSVSSGKWYWEITSGTTNQGMLGVVKQSVPILSAGFESPDAYYYWAQTGAKYNNNVGTAYGSALANGDILGTALDLDAGTITFYKNNVSLGVAYSGLSGTFSPAFDQGNITALATYNFGQRPFSYTPPTGFVALNTFNLPTATILKGNTVMDATLYTGNGSTQTITNAAGFKPDLVWYKSRSAGYGHGLFDSIRGASAYLSSSATGAESSVSGVTSFNSNGFTLGSNAGGNGSPETFVGWQWQAGQGSSSSNTNGSITSQVSANPSAGFSVVTYTGTGANATVGHGLGVAPSLIIFKARGTAINWLVYHKSVGATKALYLNLTDAAFTTSGFFNNTEPTSSVFTVNVALENNGNPYPMVAYCWSEIDGFSKFGSYTGNGSADGTFVYLGFRARYIMIKRTDSTSDWSIFDTARNSYNTNGARLWANLSSAEGSGDSAYSIFSNGFKLGDADGSRNASGGTYIYMAFAENPFRNSLAR